MPWVYRLKARGQGVSTLKWLYLLRDWLPWLPGSPVFSNKEDIWDTIVALSSVPLGSLNGFYALKIVTKKS